ncbi:hypothetical protein [Chlamydiifrater phoenicopteri]|uniref:hypothetical protein n=1 Tax=Chlamydiifrater phoenicopteri TaxID=2681469 RepID=UPI001BCD5742|nr:hypothetical protein [Chlamydiifrater phoenicopteri]
MAFINNESNFPLKLQDTDSLFNSKAPSKGQPFSKSLLSITLLALGVIVVVSGVLFLILASPAVPVTASVILGITTISFGVALLTISIMVLVSSRLSEHFDKRRGLVADLLNKISSLEFSESEREKEILIIKEREVALKETLKVQEEFIDSLESKISSNRDRVSSIQEQFNGLKIKNQGLIKRLEATEKDLKETEELRTKERALLIEKVERQEALNSQISGELQEQILQVALSKNRELELERKLLLEKKTQIKSIKGNDVLVELNERLMELVQENYILKSKLEELSQKEKAKERLSQKDEGIKSTQFSIPSFVVIESSAVSGKVISGGVAGEKVSNVEKGTRDKKQQEQDDASSQEEKDERQQREESSEEYSQE